jgi:adenosylmethionine-8-amino-7-oxononanoate aminotransferase
MVRLAGLQQRHEPGIDLAERLIKIAPVPMSKVLFQCSGSEANDTAIKLSWRPLDATAVEL